MTKESSAILVAISLPDKKESKRTYDPLWLQKELCRVTEENKRLKAELKNGQWVKCSERLPASQGRYLVYIFGFGVYMCNYEKAPSKWTVKRGRTVTHWRELPEPPKE